MAFLKHLAVEFLIVVRYSIFPTIISLLLSLIDWHYGAILAIVKLFVFLRVVHNEDRKTTLLPLTYIFVKIFAATGLYYMTEYAATFLEQRFLPSGIYPTAPQDGSSTTKVKLPKARAKRILESQRNDDWRVKALHALVRIAVHYLYIANSMAQYRWSFLAMIVIVFGLIHLILMYYLPSKKAKKRTSTTTNFGDDSSSSSDDDDDE